MSATSNSQSSNSSPSRAPFIALEGLDGAGKSSLIAALSRELQERKLKFIVSREPGGTPLAEEIRTLLIRTNAEAPVARAELLLYAAARAQHVEKLIRPTLEDGTWVICDRFTASTVAFQAGGRNLNRTDIDWLNNYATASVIPDLNILLDLTVEESRKRREARMHATKEDQDRFEREADDFHQRVRDSYLKQCKDAPSRWLVLDSRESTENMMKKVVSHFKDWMK